MRWLIAALLLAALLGGGYWVSRQPRVRELFREPGAAPARVAGPRASRPETRARPRREAAPPASYGSVPEPPATAEASQPGDQELTRTLLGILAAQGLASGVSLSVTADTVSVVGLVESREKRRRIVEILNQGRGGRKLDDRGLQVGRHPQ